MDAKNNPIQQVYQRLHQHYGAQGWWPADDAFEVMVGAILTQNTAWTNVEKAIDSLKQQGMLNAEALAHCELAHLAESIRSSGYYNQKAQRLKGFSQWFLQQGGLAGLQRLDQDELRRALLQIKGIGNETADDMLLYACERPSFVIDTYTRRLFSRLALLQEKAAYPELQQAFHQALDHDVALFQQYHALIVSHAKQHCRKRPSCEACPLADLCHYHGA